MRISVRQQLSLLLILSGGIGLAVLAVGTWVVNHDFVLSVASSQLQTTASLKAVQVASNLILLQSAATFVTTRATVQSALGLYNNGSDTDPALWVASRDDLEAILGNIGPLQNALVLQVQVYSRNVSGPAGEHSVLNATGNGADLIKLPWLDATGDKAYLGEEVAGYPPGLYPNLTISSERIDGTDPPTYAAEYNGITLGLKSTLVLGPLIINETTSLLSVTLPIVNNTDYTDILGWMTVVTDASLIQIVIQSQRGLGNTGQTLLVGPVNTTNRFSPGILANNTAGETEVRYLLPLNDSARARHPDHVYGTPNKPFRASQYPAVESAMVQNLRGVDDVGSLLRTHNEEDIDVSVGYSIPATSLVNWVVLVEQARSEVWQPINHLRQIILICLFAVLGFMLVVSLPIAHLAVMPIMRLRAATQATIDPPKRSPSGSGISSEPGSSRDFDTYSGKSPSPSPSGRGLMGSILQWKQRKHRAAQIETRDGEDKQFRIPGKVQPRKYWVRDELSDLIGTFNEMSEELYGQYTRLEDRVRQRTVELEHSKKAAEAANESKTLFVANVSHELKTPLNGILGMCAVCMDEEDSSKLRSSMGIIFSSGDLLLRTLNDLLSFSTNQVGHQVLKLEEKEFVLRDLETQITSIFGEQANDRDITLAVRFEETPEDMFGMSRHLRDITLWGDLHRILQVIINLVSNGLKFTRADGSVTVVIRCLAETPLRHSLGIERVGTITSQRPSNSMIVESSELGTACFINPHEQASIQLRELAATAPAGNDLLVVFEVRDTGPGIAENMQHRIFEPFVQGDVGLSRKHSGTGLGLSICSQLASLMKGSIEVSSTLGKGSVFTVKVPLRHVFIPLDTPRTSTPKTSLDGVSTGFKRESSAVANSSTPVSRSPSGAKSVRQTNGSAVKLATVLGRQSIDAASRADETADRANQTTPKRLDSDKSKTSAAAVRRASRQAKGKTEAKQDFSKIRILVAEDNKVNQEVILRMLKLEAILDVTIAEDGAKALELVKRHSSLDRTPPESVDGNADVEPCQPYDLIFMDVQMPNMDGLTSTRLIRELGFKRPIVALTAYAEQSNINECYGSGMDCFLAKPIKRPLLRQVLTDYCSTTPPPGKKETATSLDGIAKDENAAGPASAQNLSSATRTTQLQTKAPDAQTTDSTTNSEVNGS